MRILILTSSTGGGHDMRARSFKERAEHPECKNLKLQVKLYSALESLHGIYKFGVKIYNWIQATNPRLHHGYYNYLELMPTFRSEKTILGKDRFIEVVRKFSPQIVLSVHDHLNHGCFDLAKKAMNGNVRCVTYCGELYGGYGFSRHWVNPKIDLFLGAVQETCDMAIKLKMSKKNTHIGGFLLSPNFAKPRLSNQERINFLEEELKISAKKFTILLGTGANSANNHLSIIKTLWNANLRPQIIALCGNNENVQEEIVYWANKHKELTITALGYVKNMARLMEISSAILTRPGTGTTSEAIVSGCPIIFNGLGGVMPQEWITLKYARQHGFGALIKRPNAIVPILSNWMNSDELLNQQRKAMKKAFSLFNPVKIIKKVINTSES